MYASPSARCHASSPSDRPPASGRKSYCVAGRALKSFTVFSASRSHAPRNISNSPIGMRHLLLAHDTFSIHFPNLGGFEMKRIHAVAVGVTTAVCFANLLAQGLPTQKMLTVDLAQTIAQEAM